jgi:Clp amino terminal domain, pathogenicity island component
LFERFTEHARRSIFFARYEASTLGTRKITCEGLLLGILREDKTVAMRVGIGVLDSIRNELQQLAPPPREGLASTSVDMPLSDEAKRALRFAEEEADALGHRHIDSPHLMLGVLRIEDSVAAQLLRKRGIEYEQFRQIVGRGERAEPAPGPVAPVTAQAAWLQPTISGLEQLVDNSAARLREFADSYGDQRLKRKPWTRKEALGHLIEWAMVHHQWVTWALLESKLSAAGYPDEAAVAVQHYSDFPWAETVDLWVSLNRLLIHMLLRIPSSKLTVSCRIGISGPVSLAKVIDTYFEYCQEIVGQILARLN